MIDCYLKVFLDTVNFKLGYVSVDMQKNVFVFVNEEEFWVLDIYFYLNVTYIRNVV